MEASDNSGDSHRGARRKRYARQPAAMPATQLLTPTKVALLRFIAQCRILSLPQLADMCGISPKSARRHLRSLYDAALVDVIAVGRAALAPLDVPNDASLLFGSAPNLYILTKGGQAALSEIGLLTPEEAKRILPSYGPRNPLFLAHEVAVNDMRVWLERAVRREDAVALERWVAGTDAAIPLGELLPGRREVKPDAWFVLNLGAGEADKERMLVAFVELDRGTERGLSRWTEKVEAYGALFSSGMLPAITGFQRARVLVVTPDATRTTYLINLLRRLLRDSWLLSSFWLTEQSTLSGPLNRYEWIRADDDRRGPLVP